MEKILLDTDIGSDIDDADALVFGMRSQDMKIDLITTVYGKVAIRSKIAKRLDDYAEYGAQIAIGESIPILSLNIYPYNQGCWHTGKEGKGILSEEDLKKSPEKMAIKTNAIDFLIEKIISNKGEYNLVTIGALTNVAKALEKEPEIAKYIKHHYMMAGALSFPEVLDLDKFIQTDSPEHNIACDVRAAQIVLASSTPKTMIPLDITYKTLINREEFYALKKGDSVQQALGRLTDVWFEYRDETFGEKISSTAMHDPLTLSIVTHPELIQTLKLPIHVNSNGITVIDNCGDYINVGIEVNDKNFRELFLSTIYR